MASDREQKWEKYFSKGPVDTKIKAGKGTSALVYDTSGQIADRLEDGHPIHVPLSPSYNQRYLVVYKIGNNQKVGYVNQSFVSKPVATKGATENLGVRAETLVQKGESKLIDYAGSKVKVKYFDDHKELAKSILYGLKTNKNISEGIIEVFEKFLSSSSRYDTINWTTEVSPSEINELGKYAGEIIIGLLCLKGNKSPFNTDFFSGNVKAFCVPDDPSFAGVDSFLIMDDNEIIPISSKYGVGAKASLFANLLPKAIRHMSKMPNCVLKTLCQSTLNAGITADILEKKRGSKETLYWHGINVILKMNENKPYSVFTDIKNNKKIEKLSSLSLSAIDNIKKYRGVDQKILLKLPLSVTSFFSREIASQLNNDAKSIEFILEILAGKNFWQANLDVSKWKMGDVAYKMINSGKSQVNIIGSKAAIDDIEAKQGMINYEVKLP